MTESTEVNGDNAPSALESKIIRQIEYYFGDHNLGRDKFLQEQIKLDEGWIPLDILTKFKRLQELSTDFSVITTAIKKSNANLIEVSEDKTKIRRNAEKPLPENTEEYKQEVHAKSVYVKPFPEDTTLDQLLEYFKQHGTVENIIMRRHLKKFKGSVFVTFPSKDAAEEFLKKEDVKYDDADLFRELRVDYHKRKTEEYATIKKDKKQNKKDKEQVVEEDEVDEEKEKSKIEDMLVKDSVIKITGMDNTTAREDIKEVFSQFGEISWVDSKLGDTESFVRFKEEGTGKTAVEKEKEQENGQFTLKGKQVEVTLLQGEEEFKHWEGIKKSMDSVKNKKSGGHKRGKGYKGKRGRGREEGTRRSQRLSGGEKRSASDEPPPAKHAKTE